MNIAIVDGNAEGISPWQKEYELLGDLWKDIARQLVSDPSGASRVLYGSTATAMSAVADEGGAEQKGRAPPEIPH